jgi:tryptophan synthase beta chain
VTQTSFLLPASGIPKEWINIAADFPVPMAPPLHPGTGKPTVPSDWEGIFAPNLIAQEFLTAPTLAIPDEVREIYALWRPTPLLRAVRLEKALGTPAHIYYKNEGVSPAGSHKPNTAVPQAFFNKEAGITRIATETGAGQWGSSLALAGRLFGIDITVYMVKVSYHQKPYRKMLMESWGAKVWASPSTNTHFGHKMLKEDENSPGSLGMAISEAIEDTVTHPGTKYALGSVLNHVCMHQTIIGEEAIQQMAMAGEEPDVIIGCAGGGSNFAGIAFPFLRRNLKHGAKHRIVAVEPASCPSLTKGEFKYDFGDTASTTPLMKMYSLGAQFMPPKIHAGGLRYHGMAPTVSHAMSQGLIEAVSMAQTKVFESAILFARTEGILPAPESSHAIAAAIDEAMAAKAEGKKRVIVFNLSGHGLLDLPSYEAYLTGHIKD